MYAWEQNRSMTVPLTQSQMVRLNSQWSGYDYLRRHFGHMFPAAVSGISGDIITIRNMPFARQVLLPAGFRA